MKISKVSLSLYLLAAFFSLDFIFSGINLSMGAYETNPVYHALGQAGFITMKTLFSVLFFPAYSIGYAKLYDRYCIRLLWLILASLTVFYGSVTALNITTFFAL